MDLSEIPRIQSNEDDERGLIDEFGTSKETRIASRRRRVMIKIEAHRRAARGQEYSSVRQHYAVMIILLYSVV